MFKKTDKERIAEMTKDMEAGDKPAPVNIEEPAEDTEGTVCETCGHPLEVSVDDEAEEPKGKLFGKEKPIKLLIAVAKGKKE